MDESVCPLRRSAAPIDIAGPRSFSPLYLSKEGMEEGQHPPLPSLGVASMPGGGCELQVSYLCFRRGRRGHQRYRYRSCLCSSPCFSSYRIQGVFFRVLRFSLGVLLLTLLAPGGLSSPSYVPDAAPLRSSCAICPHSVRHFPSRSQPTPWDRRSPSFNLSWSSALVGLLAPERGFPRHTSNACFLSHPDFSHATASALGSSVRLPLSASGLRSLGASPLHLGTSEACLQLPCDSTPRPSRWLVKGPHACTAVLRAFAYLPGNRPYSNPRRFEAPVFASEAALSSSLTTSCSSFRECASPKSYIESVTHVSPFHGLSKQRSFEGGQTTARSLSSRNSVDDADTRSANTDSPSSSSHRESRQKLHLPETCASSDSPSSSSPSRTPTPRPKSSFLLSNLKAEQQRLREAREQAEASRALHAEEEKKKTERLRRRRAREASLINRKKQRKLNHIKRLTQARKRRDYLLQKRERMDRIFLEDLQVQRSTERTLRKGNPGGRREKKAQQIADLETLIRSSTLLIQIEANALTPNQRWDLVRGLALKGFYKGYKVKMAKNSLMKVAIRRILDKGKAENEGADTQEGVGGGLRMDPVPAKPDIGAGSLHSPGHSEYRLHQNEEKESRTGSSVLRSIEAPLSNGTSARRHTAGGGPSGQCSRPSVPRVRRDFWITHEEELQAKALHFKIDISGQKPKPEPPPLQEGAADGDPREHDDVELSSEARVAARLESALASAVWRNDPRFSHLALGAGPGGVWTQWEDDDASEEDMSKTAMPEEIASAGMQYMEVDDWMDLFEEEIKAMRTAKEQAKEREKEILNTTPLQGEVVSIAENAEALIPHLQGANLYVFVRAMPGNEKRLPTFVRAVFQLLEEISFDNRGKLQQKGPPQRKYKGQWYDEELLPHVKPEIAAELGFWRQPSPDGSGAAGATAGPHSPKKTTAVGGDVKMAMLGRSVLDLAELKQFAMRAPVRKKLIGKICGSLLGVAHGLTCAVQAVPSQLVSALHQLSQQSSDPCDTRQSKVDARGA